MNKSIITSVALLACVSFGTHATTQTDSWSGADKTKHVIAGAVVGSVSELYFEHNNSEHPILNAVAVGSLVGAAKEGVDALGHGDASLKDFTMTVAGAVGGALVGHGVYLIVVPESHGTKTVIGIKTTF